MDDKCIMENLLLTTKGVIDLYMHGAIESSTANIHQAFSSAFDDTLCMVAERERPPAAGPADQAEVRPHLLTGGGQSIFFCRPQRPPGKIFRERDICHAPFPITGPSVPWSS